MHTIFPSSHRLINYYTGTEKLWRYGCVSLLSLMNNISVLLYHLSQYFSVRLIIIYFLQVILDTSSGSHVGDSKTSLQDLAASVYQLNSKTLPCFTSPHILPRCFSHHNTPIISTSATQNPPLDIPANYPHCSTQPLCSTQQQCQKHFDTEKTSFRERDPCWIPPCQSSNTS